MEQKTVRWARNYPGNDLSHPDFLMTYGPSPTDEVWIKDVKPMSTEPIKGRPELKFDCVKDALRHLSKLDEDMDLRTAAGGEHGDGDRIDAVTQEDISGAASLIGYLWPQEPAKK